MIYLISVVEVLGWIVGKIIFVFLKEEIKEVVGFFKICIGIV